MILHILLGGGILDDLIGIIAGHAYYYLDDLFPRRYGYRILKTPDFL